MEEKQITSASANECAIFVILSEFNDIFLPGKKCDLKEYKLSLGTKYISDEQLSNLTIAAIFRKPIAAIPDSTETSFTFA
jgi:hypothetical protein